MFLYRDHRGGLAESMETVLEMSDFSELERHIFKLYGKGEITIKPYGFDKRINWNTHIVCHDGHVTGFTNAPVETQNSAGDS